MCELTKQLSQKRRSLWLKILGLTEAETEGNDRILICSRHFVSGMSDKKQVRIGLSYFVEYLQVNQNMKCMKKVWIGCQR